MRIAVTVGLLRFDVLEDVLYFCFVARALWLHPGTRPQRSPLVFGKGLLIPRPTPPGECRRRTLATAAIPPSSWTW